MINEPSLTEIFDQASQFVPIDGSLYLHMASSEERSVHVESWRNQAHATEFATVQEQSEFELVVNLADRSRVIKLRSAEVLDAFWKELPRKPTYIDMTGMGHHVWAPLLRSALEARLDVMFIYVEPGHYQHSDAPIEGQIFDLSEKIQGISPLPGFAFLGGAKEAERVFIPLLGFEGARLSHLLEEVQPSNERIIPIVGVPGFRAEYPFHTFLGNKRPLEQTGAWRRVRYAAANCPFSLFYVLDEIAALNPGRVMQVAPIGTKPHALGALLFKLVSNRSVEIIYDFPLRAQGRTWGTDRLLVYYVSAFGG